MNFIRALEISASGLYAQKKRIETIAQNIANADTVITEDGDPYRRKVAILAETKEYSNFSAVLDKFSVPVEVSGVAVTEVVEDPDPYKLIYDPDHPLATADGYLKVANIDTTEEMLDLMAASRAYEANATVMNTTKAMFSKALELFK